MKTSDFYYDLPDELIAQTPLARRDQSRLMVVQRANHQVAHRHFSDLTAYLEEGDCLVLNNTRVLPARIFGRRSSGAKVEFLLLKKRQNDCWECLVKPGRKARVSDRFYFSDKLSAQIVAIGEDGIRLVQFFYTGVFETVLSEVGSMPLPPYIATTLFDEERYQTVYNKRLGSAAAPTAGLHFSEALLREIRARKVEIAYLTLHVGLGTFRPVKVDQLSEHKMHAEWYQLDEDNAARIARAKAKGGRIIAVGTTSTRTLESIVKRHNAIVAASGETDIFIYPGYHFKAIDGLITNFHLPESTLLMLVSAFYDRERVMALYQLAVAKQYRFYSFGDAMLLI